MALESMPTLDVHQLDQTALQNAERIFEEMKHQKNASRSIRCLKMWCVRSWISGYYLRCLGYLRRRIRRFMRACIASVSGCVQSRASTAGSSRESCCSCLTVVHTLGTLLNFRRSIFQNRHAWLRYKSQPTIDSTCNLVDFPRYKWYHNTNIVILWCCNITGLTSRRKNDAL